VNHADVADVFGATKKETTTTTEGNMIETATLEAHGNRRRHIAEGAECDILDHREIEGRALVRRGLLEWLHVAGCRITGKREAETKGAIERR
jgi:hypothetical protein